MMRMTRTMSKTTRWLRSWTLVLGLALLATGLVACKKEKKAKPAPKKEEVEEEELEPEEARPELSSEQQAHLDGLHAVDTLLPVELAQAILGVPAPWAKDFVLKAYPEAKQKEANRVDVLFESGKTKDAPDEIDVRYDVRNKEVIGSIVLGYPATVDLEVLRAAIGEAGEPEEESKRDWIMKEDGIRITFYERGYEGGTRVGFESLEHRGPAIRHDDDDAMKEMPTWKAGGDK